ncbi:MAG: zf-HC2 domain-containing protein [Chloroflexi bacterium]|nr:zf-HC2 domain-containing protein [Chloroflexota bacterium]
MFGRKTFTDMHAWVEERLSDYIDSQLPASERAQFDKHLGECGQCRASLESMKWTVALMKQAPAVTSRRSFVLPVPVKRQPTWVFGLASFAAAAATLLFVALIGIELITQLGGPSTASAPAAAPFVAQQKSQPTMAAASAPQPTPTMYAPLFAAPTAAPMPTQAPKSSGGMAASSSSAAASSSAASSLPPAPAFQPTTVPTSAAQTTAAELATNAAQDSAKSQIVTPSPRQALTGSAIAGTAIPSSTWTATPTRTPTPVPPTATFVPTATPIPPTATLAPTATPVPPTATPQPTRAALVQTETSRAPGAEPIVPKEPFFSPLRLAQIGTFFGAVFFGVLVLLLRRR